MQIRRLECNVIGKSRNSYDGDDTWVEYGLGVNFNVSNSACLWADLQRTSGALLDEDWRASAGVRYAF